MKYGLKRLAEIGRLESQIARFEIKSRPEKVAEKLSARRAEMVRNYAEYARIAQRLKEAVCGVTDALGLWGNMRFWYQNFAREIEKLWRRNRAHYRDEVKILRYKWQVRGLNPYILDLVENAVLNELKKIERGE